MGGLACKTTKSQIKTHVKLEDILNVDGSCSCSPAYCKLDRIEKGTYTLSHISYRRLWFQVVRQTGDKLLDFIINIAEQEVRS